MTQITISIIVPIYNVESYLRQCLDSLYPQITPSMEVILVNDGSTDNSLEICKEYQIKNPSTIIINKENGGLSDARNAGTAIATGKYIYYLDSDDWLAPNALKQLHNFAEEHQCEVVQGNFYYTYNKYLLLDDRYIKDRQKPFILQRDETMRELIKNKYIKNFAWGKLYLTSIAQKHPFKKGVYFEDSYWQHHIINNVNQYGVIPTPLYYYRQRDNSISGNFSTRNLDLLKGYEERMNYIKKTFPQYTTLITKYYWDIVFSLYRNTKNSQDKKIRTTYTTYWENINEQYKIEFKTELSNYFPYIITKNIPFIIPFYILGKRIYNRLFTPKLKYIKLE